MPRTTIESLLGKLTRMNMILSVAVVALMVVNVFMIYSIMHISIVQGSGPATTTISAATTTVSSNQSASSGNLGGINTPLNASELATINDAPLQYYETAGEKLLNGTLTDEVIVSNSPTVNALVINGKPSVIYIGADSCIYCGENRWAMALALAKFGSFGSLYKGYSSLGDGDIPTLYWGQYNITTQSDVAFGNNYSSNYINFISADYESPITGGFQIQPISFFQQKAPNSTYLSAMNLMNSTGKFQGTPFTLWGRELVPGADGIVFGNTTPTSASNLPLAAMSHAQVLAQLKNFNDQFAWGEYAAADVYIAYTCPSINNTAQICQLPAIQRIELAVSSGK